MARGLGESSFSTWDSIWAVLRALSICSSSGSGFLSVTIFL